jgi:chemotaxis protein MotB
MKHKKKGHDEGHVDESWLLPYSDMMTLLLSLFIVMFASSTVDEAKFNAIMESMYSAFGGTQEVGNPITIGAVGEMTGGDGEQEMTFSDLYAALLNAVESSDYSENIDVVNQGGSIIVQFNDSVLFSPDSAIMTDTGGNVLGTIGDIFIDLDSLIGHIEIEGHTAFIGDAADQTMEAWKLSSDRAIVVLEYFALQMGYDQSKLNTAGFSHFAPVASNDTEEGRAKNRRVELYITPADGFANQVVGAISPTASAPATSEAATGETTGSEAANGETTASEPETTAAAEPAASEPDPVEGGSPEEQRVEG